MGIQNYRGLKYFAYINMAICAFFEAVFFMNMYGYTLMGINFVSLREMNAFTGFTLVAVLIGIIGVFSNKTEGLSDDDVSKINDKMKPYKMINILLIGYIAVGFVVVRNPDLLISSCILEASYFASMVYTRKMYELIITDHQLRWQKAMYGDQAVDDELSYSSILWRYKIWFAPFESVPFSRRYLRKDIVLTTVIIALFLYKGLMSSFPENLFLIPFVVVWLIQFMSILEYILGLYTSITGMCTGVEEFTDSHRSSRSDDYRYYRVYVTDFEHKRELVFETYDYMEMYKNENIKVIHGIFSKKAIMVNNMKIRYR